MPGGLTRVSTTAGDPVVSMQSGGGSKDTWVLSDGPVAPVSLLTPAGQPVSTARVTAELPSRVADNLFWLGRYAERLEGRLRLLRCVISRMADEASSESSPELGALAQTLAGLELLPPRFTGRTPQSDLAKLACSLPDVGVMLASCRLRNAYLPRYSSHTLSVVRRIACREPWSGSA